MMIGRGELPGRDHHRHLQQQGRERQKAQTMAGEDGGGDAENGKGEGEIVPAQRIEHVDAAGKNLPRIVALGHGFGGH